MLQRTPSEGEKPSMQSEKTLINHSFIKRLFSRIYKEYMTQLKKKKKITQLKKWEKDLNIYFSKEDTQVANAFMKSTQHH